MEYGFVYETINLVNGHKYIGQHRRRQNPEDPDDSWYLGSGKILCYAIEKYGWENFSRRILCECKNQEELNEKEAYYISYYNAVESDEYYNIAKDAYPHSGFGEEHWIYKKNNGHLTEEHKKNLSKAQVVRWTSVEAREKMSKTISSTLIGNTRREGTKQSAETRKKISEANKGCEIPLHVRELNSRLRTETNTARFAGTITITNGLSNRRVRPGTEIPEGWWRGMTMKKRS